MSCRQTAAESHETVGASGVGGVLGLAFSCAGRAGVLVMEDGRCPLTAVRVNDKGSEGGHRPGLSLPERSVVFPES